jgi:biopolymer transport protein ExbB
VSTVETIKNLFVDLGASWVLWLLFALSAGSLTIAIERLLYLRTKADDVRALAAELDAHLAAGAREAALAALAGRRSVGAAVARAGLRLAPRGVVAAEKGMQSAIAAERQEMERRLAYLGTLGNNAPFVGLFGTVIGVILAFEELGRAGGAAGGTGPVASAGVMSAIAEALVATAVGIGVALPAVAAYNYFQRRITGAGLPRERRADGSDGSGRRAVTRWRPGSQRRTSGCRGGRVAMASAGPRRGALIEGINVTPLVDITLVLLVIFIVTAKLVVTPGVPLDLPVASQSEAQQTVLSVIVPVSGPILVDGAPIDEAALAARVRAVLAREPATRAVIQADRAVPHGRVLGVLDAMKAAGLARVAFGAVPPTDAAPASTTPAGTAPASTAPASAAPTHAAPRSASAALH